MKKFLYCCVVFLALPVFSSAATSPVILPTAAGTYNEWTPKSGTTHYTAVDETTCNGTTDYVATSTIGKRDSYTVALSSIPNNALITAIAIAPCASRATTGTGSSVLNVFYRYNGANGSNLGSYAPSGTTPSALATSTWSGLSLVKTSTSTLEIGMVYTSGTKGGRLSRIATQLTYGLLPSATTSAASSISTSTALLNGTVNPNGTSTSAWFRISSTHPGTCTDTFGTRVPASGGTSIGSGTSSVAYSTTTTGLTQNTTYYYCAIASNGYGKGYGAVQSFTTTFIPITTNITSAISATTTWTTAGGVYLLDGTISVNAGVTLTINPGVIVKFKTGTSRLDVYGTLDAVGTSDAPIYFTSYADDTVGGDTNNDGASAGAAGNWDAIISESGASTTLSYAKVYYGGYAGVGYTGAALYSLGKFNLLNSEVATGSYNGVQNASNGDMTVMNSAIHGYNYAVFVDGNAMTVTGSSLNTSNYYAIYVGPHGPKSLTLTNNTISGYGSGVGYFDLNQNMDFIHSGNSATGTMRSGFLMSGTLNENQTWGADGIPYIVADGYYFTINTGKTLTLDPGVIFKFDGPGAQMVVLGALVANGTAALPDYFTSMKDDTVGGDTNNDASATTPAPGNWDGIVTTGGASTMMTHAVVRYAGHSDCCYYSASNLLNNGGVLTVVNSEVGFSSNYGIRNNSGTTTLIGSSLLANSFGFYQGGGVSLIANAGNTIASSTSYGIYNPAGPALNAAGISWPATTGALSTGPYEATVNPTGNGDTVSTFVNFTPWVTTVSGNITTNTTWTASSTYVVDGVVTINSGSTLIIKNGTVVKFKTTTSGIVVNGVLTVNSAGSPLKAYLTSYEDDTVGGDTNGDGGATTPAAGDWGNIKINTGGVASTSYAVIRNAGGSAGSTVWNNGGILELRNTEVASGTSYGIYETSGYTLVVASDVHHHSVGILVGDTVGEASSIGSSWIHDNSSYGLYNSTAATSTVYATYNYWGSASGPYNAKYNPSGTGNAVSDYVAFSPWLTQMHYLYLQGGSLLTAVDSSKEIDWDGTTAYSTEWNDAVNLWNGLGDVNIAPWHLGEFADLTIDDVPAGADSFVAAYFYNFAASDDLKFNDYYMASTSSTPAYRLNATAHELGHALGLYHSYLGNMMNPYVTSTTTLGLQDVIDYQYCWLYNQCP